MTLRIESDIPMPPIVLGRPKGELRQTLEAMKPEQSVFIDEPDANRLHYAARRAFGKGNYAIRIEKHGHRIWRRK